MRTNRYLFMAMIILLIIMSACSDKKTTEPVAKTTTVTRIVVTSTSQTVGPGGQVQFSAEVIGANNPSQSVQWSVITHTGSTIKPGTSVSASGLLTVAGDESTQYLTVVAKSNLDDTKSGWLTVSTTGSAPPTATGVNIYPANATVQKGGTLNFEASVTGVPYNQQYITWSLTGGGAGTSIAETDPQCARLTVSSSEPDFTYLTVRATYSLDSSVYKEAQVSVEPAGFNDAENWVYLVNDDEEEWDSYDSNMRPAMIGWVWVEISRATAINTVTVKVNNVTLDGWGYPVYVNGHYTWEGDYSYTTTFVPGQTYAVVLTINNETPINGSVEMVYTPSVSAPATFDRTRHMTYNWTMGKSAIVQGLGLWGDALYPYDDFEIFEGYIPPSQRSYVVEANTVPANWVELEFFLGEANFVLTGKTMFVCSVEYYKFYSQGGAAVRQARTHKERVQRMQRLIKGS